MIDDFFVDIHKSRRVYLVISGILAILFEIWWISLPGFLHWQGVAVFVCSLVFGMALGSKEAK